MLNKLNHLRDKFVTRTKYVLTNEDNVESHTSTYKDECVICWEQLAILDDANIWQSPLCLHLFHKNCLIPWQGENSLKSTLVEAICPLCRIYDDPIFIGKEEVNSLENFASMKKGRNQHNATRTKIQKKQAVTMINSSETIVGDIVAITAPPADRTHTWKRSNILGIVFEVSKSGGRGVRVITKFGIIIKFGHEREDAFIGSDKYVVVHVALTKILQSRRQQILDDKFDPSVFGRVSMREAFTRTTIPNHQGIGSPRRRLKIHCNCGNDKCGPRCGCRKAQRNCTTLCRCGGRCPDLPEVTVTPRFCRCKGKKCGLVSFGFIKSR